MNDTLRMFGVGPIYRLELIQTDRNKHATPTAIALENKGKDSFFINSNYMKNSPRALAAKPTNAIAS